jgi:carbon storage regulator CsrA
LVVEQVAGDSVVIAGNIEVVLLRVKGDRAHIGVIAPEDVAIARGEVYRERARDYLT